MKDSFWEGSGLLYFPAWAKLNLGLKVGAQRPDGYHEIKSVMQTVSLADRVELEAKDNGISLEVVGAELPTDGRNLAVRAAQLVRDRFQVATGVHIKLTKNIPLAAGLAGGSADAAAVLYGLNRYWQLNLGLKDLVPLAADLGSDVPFALLGGTGLAEGRGEVVSTLVPLPRCYFVLACPPVAVSTAWAYNELDRTLLDHHHKVDIDALLAGLERRDLGQMAALLANSFEPVVMAHFPLIRDIKETLLAAGALAALMSGSGPTVYGLFAGWEEANAAVSVLDTAATTYVVEPVSVGAGRLIEE